MAEADEPHWLVGPDSPFAELHRQCGAIIGLWCSIEEQLIELVTVLSLPKHRSVLMAALHAIQSPTSYLEAADAAVRAANLPAETTSQWDRVRIKVRTAMGTRNAVAHSAPRLLTFPVGGRMREVIETAPKKAPAEFNPKRPKGTFRAHDLNPKISQLDKAHDALRAFVRAIPAPVPSRTKGRI